MTRTLLMFAAAVALAGPAFAADDAPSQAVSVRDVNLNDAAQTHVLYERLQRTARQVCGDSLADFRLTGMSDSTCVRLTMTDAVKKVDAPRLTAMLNTVYGAGTGGRAFAADAR